jgi:(2Fe-2S) ferredoxin
MGKNTVVEKSIKILKVPKRKDIIALIKFAGLLELKTIRRHLFLRAELGSAKCCSWQYLKKQYEDLKLDCIFKIKVNCLRVWCEGSIMGVYPHGVWYRPVTLEVKKAHNSKTPLIGNKVVKEYAFLPTHYPIHPLRLANN